MKNLEKFGLIKANNEKYYLKETVQKICTVHGFCFERRILVERKILEGQIKQKQSSELVNDLLSVV